MHEGALREIQQVKYKPNKTRKERGLVIPYPSTIDSVFHKREKFPVAIRKQIGKGVDYPSGTTFSFIRIENDYTFFIIKMKDGRMFTGASIRNKNEPMPIKGSIEERNLENLAKSIAVSRAVRCYKESY